MKEVRTVNYLFQDLSLIRLKNKTKVVEKKEEEKVHLRKTIGLKRRLEAIKQG